MRLLLVVSLAFTFLATLGSVSASPPMHIFDNGIDFTARCVPSQRMCEFEAVVTDPNLIFFRWDFNGDGIWDSGYPGSHWTSNLRISNTYAIEGVYLVCLGAWDGVSSRGQPPEPVGPTTCKTLVLGGTLIISPAVWTRNSLGRVTAVWEYPPELARSPPPIQHPTLSGVPAIPMVRRSILGEPPFVLFRADRASLTAFLGPGTHGVILTGDWAGGYLFAEGDVTIT